MTIDESMHLEINMRFQLNECISMVMDLDEMITVPHQMRIEVCFIQYSLNT
jgi:hypothetical protein